MIKIIKKTMAMLCVLFLASCVCVRQKALSQEQASEMSDEQQFQEICIPLAIEFLKLANQLGQTTYFKTQDPRIDIEQDSEGKIYDELLTETVDSLREFIARKPQSKWADDAAVIIANVIKLKPREAVLEWEKIVSVYPDAQIEQWSVQNLMFIPGLVANNILLDVSLLKIGEMKYLMQDWEGAIESFGNLTKRYESSPLKELPDIVRRAHFAIPQAYAKLGKNDEMIAYLNEIIKLYPDSVMAPMARRKLDEIKRAREKRKENARQKEQDE